MKLIRLLVGICAGLGGVCLVLGIPFLFLGWTLEPAKDWSFLWVLGIGLCGAVLLLYFARWCFKRRPSEDSPVVQDVAPRPLPPPIPVPEKVIALGEVGQALFALNNTDVPFQVLVGDGKEADLIVEWKLVDARWRELLQAAGVQKVFRIFLKLDPATREVRSLDREFDLSWNVNHPVLCERNVAHATIVAKGFRGRKFVMEHHMTFRGEDVLNSLLGLMRGKWVPPKPIYEYQFNTREMKTPIAKAVTSCGWTLRQIAFGEL